MIYKIDCNITFKHPVKITSPTKQRLFREGLGFFLLGFDGSPLKISGTPQNLQEKASYVVMTQSADFDGALMKSYFSGAPPAS